MNQEITQEQFYQIHPIFPYACSAFGKDWNEKVRVLKEIKRGDFDTVNNFFIFYPLMHNFALRHKEQIFSVLREVADEENKTTIAEMISWWKIINQHTPAEIERVFFNTTDDVDLTVAVWHALSLWIFKFVADRFPG